MKDCEYLSFCEYAKRFPFTRVYCTKFEDYTPCPWNYLYGMIKSRKLNEKPVEEIAESLEEGE